MTDAAQHAAELRGPWGPQSRREDDQPAQNDATDGGLSVEFIGHRGALFWLALKCGILTILTLGFYRFWMKTRMRRWYWSAMRPGGQPFEYVGDPIEKLLGFFIAVVILTFYIGILNLLLMFVSFSLFSSSVVGYVASFAGVIPLWFYARYRARRYVLGRTRWRGVRFGLEKGAFGYAWRALVHWAITIVTLGILWPRMTFWLEKYRTDRTYFGSARLTQGGRWQMLIPATYPFIAAALLLTGFMGWLIYDLRELSVAGTTWIDALKWLDATLETGKADQLNRIFTRPRIALAVLVVLGLVYGAIHYNWVSKRILANHKHAPGITFASRINPRRITLIYVLGTFISYVVLIVGVFAVVFGALTVLGVGGLGNPFGLNAPPRWISTGILVVLYMSAFLMWGVLHNIFVTFPIMRHMAKTTSLPQTAGLAEISQRARDEFAEAEGFAEALDLGAAI